MNALRNRVQLIGNLGNTPEAKTLESGTKLAKFTMATNETYKNQKGEKVTEITERLLETYVESENWDLGVKLWPSIETKAQSNSNLFTEYVTSVYI